MSKYATTKEQLTILKRCLNKLGPVTVVTPEGKEFFIDGDNVQFDKETKTTVIKLENYE